jgi:hypothetical protein
MCTSHVPGLPSIQYIVLESVIVLQQRQQHHPLQEFITVSYVSLYTLVVAFFFCISRMYVPGR